MIAYTDIVEKVAEILEEELEATTILVEPPEVGASPYPEVGVSLMNEASEERTIGPPNPYFSTINVEVFCSEYSPDGVREACRKRDTLVGKVRDVLKTNRTLDGLCDNTQLGNIEFVSARTDAGFFSAAIITLKVFVTS